MAIKIGINGFGRIGRVLLRILMKSPEKFDVCGINLRKADIDYMVYLLKYDSVFRNFEGTVENLDGNLVVNGHKIRVFSENDAAMIPWSQCGAEYILECTGANNTTEKASRHFKGGAKRVLLTAPAKDEATPTFVYGINSKLYRPDMKVVSAASCTTFDTKDRSQRRLTKRYGYLFAKTFQSVCQTDRGRGLSFSGWSRVDRGHQNQFSILALGLLQKTVVYLCLIISILLQILLVYACCLCNLTDFQWIRCLCNLNICHHYSCTSLFLRFCLFRSVSTQ